MRILFLSSHADPSGAEICLLRLLKNISCEKNIELLVINSQEGLLNEEIKKLNIKVTVIKGTYLKKIFLPSEIIYFFKKCNQLKKTIRYFNPDIIHAFTLPLARRVILLKLLNINYHIVGTIHDEFKKSHFGIFNFYLYKYSLNNYYKKIITVSNNTREIANFNGINKNLTTTIYNGIEIKQPVSYQKINDKYTIGSFGRITPSKGQLVLLEAIKIIGEKRLPIKFLIIGKPSLGIKGSLKYYKDIIEYIQANKLQNFVEIIEWTNNIDLYYEKLDLYVHSSLNHDPFPTVILESMNYKIPVIATLNGGAKEQIIDNVTGYLIDINNPNLLADKILKLYKDSGLSRSMGQRGYERLIEMFDIQRYAEDHLMLYKSIINK
ncbi:MAG: glycosyltransferase family 4 protein [Bacteroidia bacterium]